MPGGSRLCGSLVTSRPRRQGSQREVLKEEMAPRAPRALSPAEFTPRSGNCRSCVGILLLLLKGGGPWLAPRRRQGAGKIPVSSFSDPCFLTGQREAVRWSGVSGNACSAGHKGGIP